MTKTLILIALLVLLYLYWKSQQKNIAPKTDDILERKGKDKQTFWDASDFGINSDSDDNNSNYD